MPESPVMDELLSMIETISETMKKLSVKTAEAQRLVDEKLGEAELKVARSPALFIKEKQELVQRQEQPKQRQKRRAKERDWGMEL